jgi:hypothetical protein
LYREDFGAPNVSIRVLIAMMVLKEAQGWSDSQLFENCRFNFLVRTALGLPNVDISIPAPSTYYLLRKRIVDWEKAGNGNLMETVFAQLTKSQLIEFDINGSKIRMDSKLFCSNIAWYSRYEMIHETLKKAYLSDKERIDSILSESDISLLTQISNESGEKVSYYNNQSTIESKLVQLGSLIYRIISYITDNITEPFETLCLVFSQQYEIIDDIVKLLPKQNIKASSVQSPHDTDCHYRKKGDKQVKGYSVNVTETCDSDNKLNLITSVIVAPASAADRDFLQPAIESTQGIISQKIDSVNSDGAFHSPINQEYCKENKIDFIVGAISGKQSRYDLSLTEDDGLIVIDTQTNTVIPTIKVKPHKALDPPKWKILTDNEKNRYFTLEDVETCLLRKQIGTRTKEELNPRNNIEATIFQLGYHYPNDKSRYRGIIKHKIWVNARCIWVNFVRIMKLINSYKPNNVQNVLCYEQIDNNYGQISMKSAQSFLFCVFNVKNLLFFCKKIIRSFLYGFADQFWLKFWLAS